GRPASGASSHRPSRRAPLRTPGAGAVTAPTAAIGTGTKGTATAMGDRRGADRTGAAPSGVSPSPTCPCRPRRRPTFGSGDLERLGLGLAARVLDLLTGVGEGTPRSSVGPPGRPAPRGATAGRAFSSRRPAPPADNHSGRMRTRPPTG